MTRDPSIDPKKRYHAYGHHQDGRSELLDAFPTRTTAMLFARRVVDAQRFPRCTVQDVWWRGNPGDAQWTVP